MLLVLAILSPVLLMSSFAPQMKDNLRTPAQGADTVVWLAISKAALKHPSGLFFQGERAVNVVLYVTYATRE